MQTNPRPQLISIMAAFGARALIAALSVELVAPTVFALDSPEGHSTHGSPIAGFLALATAIVAGLTYELNSEIKDVHVKPGSRFSLEWGISQRFKNNNLMLHLLYVSNLLTGR